MPQFNLGRAHQSHLEQLIGCRYAALRHLAQQLAPSLKASRGRPYQRCAKVQLVCDEAEQIAAVGRAWPGSVHDKTVFDKEGVRLADTLKSVMLADKAYAGATGEGSALLRPIKKGERAWKEPGAARFNEELGKKRVKVEHVFARLKTFRALQGLFPYRWERLGDIVRALAVVHNLNRQMAVQIT